MANVEWASRRGGRSCPLASRLRVPLSAVVGFSALSAVLLSIPAAAPAQPYETDPIDQSARSLSGTVIRCIRDPSAYATEKERFSDYFTKYYFPSMTRFGPDDLAGLGDMRYKLFNDHLWRSQSDELRRDLTDLSFKEVNRIVFSSKYHPAVRYNGMLILGMLDEQYGDDRGGQPPKPLPVANATLTKVVEAAAQGKRVPPSLLVGALVGLERHARHHESLDRQAVDGMTAAVVKLAALDPPLPEVSRSVSEWIKLQTATILATHGGVGANQQAHDVLVKFLADEKISLDGRCRVAALLTLMKYEGATVDGKTAAERILSLAAEVVQAEAKRAKDFEDMQLAGGGFGGYGGRSAGRRSIDYGQPVEFDRQTLLARLADLRSGMSAIKPIAPADVQPTFDLIVAAIRTVVTAAENRDEVDLDLVNKVQTMAAEVQQIAKASGAAVADPPAEEPSDSDEEFLEP